MFSLPRYKCHKEVQALKIKLIEVSDFASPKIIPEGDYDKIEVTSEYLVKHNPQVGGYYVRYDDGYESFSPAKAFEEGYTLVDPPHEEVQ